MGRASDAVLLLESFAGSTLRAGRPADDALVALMVHIALSDGTVDDGELAMLRQVFASDDDATLRARIRQILDHPLDLHQIAVALESDDQRWTAVRFAARVASKDGDLAAPERAFLDALAGALGLPASAVDRALQESLSRPLDRLSGPQLRAAIAAIGWDAAMFADGGVASPDLVPVVPADVRPVLRIGVDQAEVLGLYEEGVVGRFLEGPAFLRWSEIVAASPGAGLESSVRLHMEDGRTWSLVDTRLGGLAMLIDRLHRGPAATSRAPVAVQRVRRLEATPTWDDGDAP